MKSLVIQSFRETYGADPQWVVRGPGRVNLIGDHTDYNEGFVLPMAIDLGVWVALRPREQKQVVLKSLDFKEVLKVDLEDLHKGSMSWEEYLKAVAWAMRDGGVVLHGWEGVVAGNIPIGSGLSSSAAFELAIARAFAAAANWPWQPLQVAKWMQKAENEWVGVASGIMDPLISAVAEEGKAALIDCRDLEITQVTIPSSLVVVIMNTMKRRGLVNSAYNERRRQCEMAAHYFGARSLRDVSLDSLALAKGKLADVIYRRARHVLSENGRVTQMAKELEKGDSAAAGSLMTQSHASLRDDFEVSCTELDVMVAAASEQAGCFGARMTGAGFGGCVVALVEANAVDQFIRVVSAQYRNVTGIRSQLLVSSPARGAELEVIS